MSETSNHGNLALCDLRAQWGLMEPCPGDDEFSGGIVEADRGGAPVGPSWKIKKSQIALTNLLQWPFDRATGYPDVWVRRRVIDAHGVAPEEGVEARRVLQTVRHHQTKTKTLSVAKADVTIAEDEMAASGQPRQNGIAAYPCSKGRRVCQKQQSRLHLKVQDELAFGNILPTRNADIARSGGTDGYAKTAKHEHPVELDHKAHGVCESRLPASVHNQPVLLQVSNGLTSI